ncbi:hypothetical protein K438DRAFT_208575 [Mycena galopus ATCC 62051]|nr:hypothetical protein K438DRAFT_208575 [Mycena galopus ATCC 62051]
MRYISDFMASKNGKRAVLFFHGCSLQLCSDDLAYSICRQGKSVDRPFQNGLRLWCFGFSERRILLTSTCCNVHEIWAKTDGENFAESGPRAPEKMAIVGHFRAGVAHRWNFDASRVSLPHFPHAGNFLSLSCSGFTSAPSLETKLGCLKYLLHCRTRVIYDASRQPLQVGAPLLWYHVSRSRSFASTSATCIFLLDIKLALPTRRALLSKPCRTTSKYE